MHMDKETSKIRVGIIGAGPSGLAQLRAFESAAKKGSVIPDKVCFEKQEDCGGLWNYSWRTGTDEYGEPVHNGMYRNLWSNGPKECLEFSDYTFEEHFRKIVPSYPPREVLLDYIKGRLDNSSFRSKIRFKTAVRYVSYNKETGLFTLLAHNLIENKTYNEDFDFIVCASGHFSTPNIPQFKGIDKYEGRILHSHDFRNAKEFIGKDILLIGASYSTEDIASQCYKYGCKSVTISYRSREPKYIWPDSFKQVPLLVKVDADNTVHFKNGYSRKVDAIILCTGYIHCFPFLQDDLRLETENRLWPLNLYKGIFWVDNPKMIYLGMQDQYYTFNMFDAQAWYSRDYILKKLVLKSKDLMIKENQKWRDREETLLTEEQKIVFQGDYVKDLSKDTDYPNLDVDGINNGFFDWLRNKHDDILGYRNYCFKSLMTGNMSVMHHTKWLDEMDDSMDNFLNKNVK